VAGNQTGRRPAQQSGHGSWWSDAGNAIDQARRAAEAKGRELWEAAIREGRPIAAATQEELRALGAKAIQEGAKYVRQNLDAAKGIAAVVKDPHSAESQRFIRETKNNAKAALHGAGDAFTMGLADRGSSAIRATLQSKGDLSQWKKNYHADMDQERAQDAYEAANYGDARRGGEVAGTVASLLVPGADLGVAARIGKVAMKALPAVRTLGVPVMGRIAEATPAIMKERIAAAVASGGLGAGNQALSDTLEGRRVTAGDLGAGAVGGFVQGIGGHALGHIGTGAVGGAVTAGLDDVLNARPISLADMATAGMVGAGMGGLAGIGAARWADSLPTLRNSAPITKNMVGEVMSVGRSLARGSTPTSLREKYINLPGSPGARQDHEIDFDAPVEAKFGRTADLRKGQRAVYNQGRYARVDHFVPQDVATVASIPASQMVSDLVDGWEQDRRDRGWNPNSLLVVPGY
jgi:hypothetical protein